MAASSSTTVVGQPGEVGGHAVAGVAPGAARRSRGRGRRRAGSSRPGTARSRRRARACGRCGSRRRRPGASSAIRSRVSVAGWMASPATPCPSRPMDDERHPVDRPVLVRDPPRERPGRSSIGEALDGQQLASTSARRPARPTVRTGHDPAATPSRQRIAAARPAPSPRRSRQRTARPGPGNGWRQTISCGRPSCSPSTRTSSL